MKITTMMIVGCLIAILGIVLPVCVYGYFDRIQWEPLDKPVKLSTGNLTETFQINYSARYFMRIEFAAGSIPHDKLLCLVGIHGFSRAIAPECASSDTVLQFSWELSRGGMMIQSGRYDQTNSGGGSSPELVHADFAHFDGMSGETYILAVRHISPRAETLNAATPRLLVSVNPVNYESVAVLKGCSWLGAGVLFLAGMLVVVVGRNRARQ